jgi:EAL domain-containing protein (putative c-di-GMP-specific phosphodiesterase class I)
MKEWREELPSAADMVVHVNLSGRQFMQPGLVEHVARILERTGLPANALGLEMTETVLMNDPELARAMLEELRSLGVRIQLDDFGTGYSSLAYLHRFPIHGLKIDRAFVAGAVENPENAKIVRSITALARDLELKTVAEGIETAAQLELLRSLGCDAGQGNHLCEPLFPEGVAPVVARGRLRRLPSTATDLRAPARSPSPAAPG